MDETSGLADERIPWFRALEDDASAEALQALESCSELIAVIESLMALVDGYIYTYELPLVRQCGTMHVGQYMWDGASGTIHVGQCVWGVACGMLQVGQCMWDNVVCTNIEIDSDFVCIHVNFDGRQY